ncbi:MAG: HprK-related kinase A [Burkholderiales bacterium]|nr:HprK-related kinase A [Burkholderiales bacterium]
MTLGRLSPRDFAQRLAAEGLPVRIEPFTVRVRSDIPALASGLRLHYAAYDLAEDGFADFHVQIARRRALRRWIRPQADFVFDGARPFKPLPLAQAYPMFEWGFNWCIANHCHQYVMIHAAVMERDDRALVMAAPPGSGKSTLCAGLVCSGWRLLSDELALIDPDRLALIPVPRPISLKNASIEVIRRYAPDGVIGPAAHDTHKGTVAHLRAPEASVLRAGEPARPGWVVFPRWEAGAPARLAPRTKARAVLGLMENSFNYSNLARRAFDTLTRLVDRSDCFDFSYGVLEDAAACFGKLEPPAW